MCRRSLQYLSGDKWDELLYRHVRPRFVPQLWGETGGMPTGTHWPLLAPSLQKPKKTTKHSCFPNHNTAVLSHESRPPTRFG